MPLQIVRNDITKMECDAIVNATNYKLIGSGGVAKAIQVAAGPGLQAECQTLGGCEPGHAKITGGYNLPCKYVIHTAGPRWFDGKSQEKDILASCYQESLRLAKDHKCASVAFPLISTGALGYPKDQALQVAISEISKFLLRNEMLVYLVVYDKDCFRISKKLINDIIEYIDECYVEAHYFERDNSTVLYTLSLDDVAESVPIRPQKRAAQPTCVPKKVGDALNLSDMLGQLDESFSQMLLRKIDEKGMTDAQCYKKANIDRKLFSKIRNDVHYKPSKATAVAFAIALELSLGETRDLLTKAGYALSHSSKFDIIIEYFIRSRNYNIMEINDALYTFDQSLLGG